MTYQVHAYRGTQYCTVTRKTAGGALYMCRALHKLGWVGVLSEGCVMRLIDWMQPLYRFGIYPDGCVDLNWDQDELLTRVKPDEAAKLIRLVDNYNQAFWFLCDRASPDTLHELRERIGDDPRQIEFDWQRGT